MAPDGFFEMHSEFCKALSHPSRLRILSALSHGERSFSDLLEHTGQPKATLSRHLTALTMRGVVSRRRDGKHVRFAVGNQKIVHAYELMTEALHEILSREMHAVVEGARAHQGHTENGTTADDGREPRDNGTSPC